MKSIPELMMEIRDGFSIELISEDACRDWFLRTIHPSGAFCPECNHAVTGEKKLQAFWSLRRVTCQFCGRTFSAVTGTALKGIGIDFRALYILLFMVSHGTPAKNVSKQLRISNGAAYVWTNKAKGKL